MSTRRKPPLAGVLGPLEADVMDVVWRDGVVTVRDVYEELSRTRSIAYTTVMTTMARLSEKGLLEREEDNPAHRYSAALTREQYADSTVRSVLDWLVKHFREPAVAYFVDRAERDEDILESLRDAIEQYDQRPRRADD